MKFARLFACGALLLGSLAWGQEGGLTQIITFPVFSLNAAPVPGATLSLVGQPGQQNLCYWAVANYPIGSVVSPLGCVSNGANTLTGSNYVSITPWLYPSSVTSVDILRNTSATVAPTGSCNCAVQTGLTSGAATDQSNSLSSYTVALLNPASFDLTLTNETVGTAATHLMLRQGATYPGTLVRDLSLSGGSGGVSGTGTPGTLTEWSGSATNLGNAPIVDTGVLTFSEPIEAVLTQQPMLLTDSPAACGGTGAFINIPLCRVAFFTMQPPAASAGVSAGFYAANFGNTTSSNTPAFAGVYGNSTFSSSGSPSEVAGTVGVGFLQGNGTPANVSGVFGLAALQGSETATATVFAGVAGQVQNQSSANTQPFGAALYARPPSFTSPITNIYGLYIADQTAGGGTNNPNPHGIYEAGAAPNVLNGSLTLAGISGSTQCLHVSSAGLISGTGADCGSGGGSVYTLQIGGVSLTAGDTVNFNGTLPAAITNSINVIFQTSKASTTDSVSAYLLGDGNVAHCLSGIGTWVACTGGGSGNVSNSGTPTTNQLAVWVTSTTIEGLTTLPTAAMPALTGDITTPGASLATTLATVNSNVGSFTSANITVDAKGRITAAASGTGGSFSPVITSPANTQNLVYNGTNWVNAYAGVNVDAQTTDYTFVCPTDRLGEIEFNISAAHGFYLPQAGSTACTGSSMAMVVRNTSTSTASLTICSGTGTSGSCTAGSSSFLPEARNSVTLPPGAALFIYSDATTSTGNYHDISVSTPFGGINEQTTTYALTLLDKDKVVVMNCSAACVATLASPPPSTKWNARILSIGSTLATVSLNSLTFNGAATAPTLTTGQSIEVVTDGTNYFGDISAGGASGANTALSNLAAVSINTSLLAQTGTDLGSTTHPFRNAYLFGAGTYGTDSIELTGTPTANRVLTFPDATDTLADLAGTQALTNKTYNGLTLTALSTGFSLAGGTTSKTLTINNTITLAGTDASTYTFPGASATIPQTVASGTSALGTAAISSGACATVVTTTATGTSSTDAIEWTPNASIKAVTGFAPATTGGLSIAAYPTSGNVNFDVCNWSSGSITPGAVTLNWRVVR